MRGGNFLFLQPSVFKSLCKLFQYFEAILLSILNLTIIIEVCDVLYEDDLKPTVILHQTNCIVALGGDGTSILD